jgi:hypothetical protein
MDAGPSRRYTAPMIFGDNPRGRESTAWRWVGLWVAFIYLTIPLARILQETVRERAGKEVFLWITFLAFAVAAAWIVRAFFRRQWKPRPAQIAVLCGIGGLFSWLAWSLRANPEEAFHFVQYGVLSILLFRALRHRLSDSSLYLTATLIGSAFGILDELIQWVVPRRYFDFRDIWINVQAVGLVQIALAAGIRPPGIRGRPTPAGLQHLCRAAIAVLLLLLVCVSGTPRAVAFLTRFLPAAAALDHVPAEYGFRIEDPRIGVFFSRLPPDELLRQDRERGAETAQHLNRVRSDEQYKAFLRETPAHLHPLAVEARIHLFRRDRYAGHALWATNREVAAGYAHVAFHENQILQNYFSNTLHRSTFSWPQERIRRIEELAREPAPYQSAVSRSLITKFSQNQITALLVGLLLLAIAGERFAARKIHP